MAYRQGVSTPQNLFHQQSQDLLTFSNWQDAGPQA
jgi:hypothetical protein